MRNILEYFSSPGSSKYLKILVIVALVLFVTAILVFWFGSSSFSERGVEFKIEGPQQALSGDEATYKITYSNTTRTDIKDIKFRFFYPDHAIVIKEDGSYSEETSETFELDSVGARQSGEKEFKAFLVGEKGSILYAKADMTYKAGTLSSRFEKKPVSAATTIIGMPVPVTLSVPPIAVSGQEITYTLDYRNESQGDIADLRFKLAYPEGFAPKRFSPQPTTGDATWDIKLLKKDSGARITVTGTISGNERDSKTVSMILQRKINGDYINYERAEASTIISSPLLDVKISVNGERDYTASPGDILAYSIQYRNSSSYTFSGLNLLLKLEGEMYDLNSLDPTGGFYDSATQTIVWNAGSVPNFSNLGPSATGKVDFRIRLKSSFSGGLGSKNFFVKTTASLVTSDIPTGLDGEEISTQDSLITKISTQPNVIQTMYYSDPAFGSFGPMPLNVGSETMFTVHWRLVNPGNAVNNAVVKATLPTGVAWKNIVSSATSQSQPAYDRNKGQVIWSIGQLPSGSGTSSIYEVSFQVSITPSSTQRGSAPTLVKNGTFAGTDSFTQQSVLLNLDDLTTSDTIDRSADGTVE
ncbi:MAG: hypothetical protein AAB479_02485 [Patescibacteria group bacterium]